MIALGFFDEDIDFSIVKQYVNRVKQLTGLDWGEKLRSDKSGNDGWVGFAPAKKAENEMKVTEVQQFLKDAGFCPAGRVDGICGYRTSAGIRLFQEYVRTVEGDSSIGGPDAKLGRLGFGHIRRWQASGKTADWKNGQGMINSENYNRGIELLEAIKQHCLSNPDKMMQKINNYSKSRTDTLKVHEWDFNPAHTHLIGVRKNTAADTQKFNDIFFLLIRGQVFIFNGSTDPGKTKNVNGAPFLVKGQHLYRFGWHNISKADRVYQALKPKQHGVLVVRSKGDFLLTDDDLNKELENNLSINVHWGGEGFKKVGGWSEGCQVIAGKAYINHRNELVDCAKYAAAFYDTLGNKVNGNYQTKGAYTVLNDVVAAFSNDTDNIVHYTLISEDDLAVNSKLTAMIEDARGKFSGIRWA